MVVPGAAPELGSGGIGVDVHQPAERQHDADDHTGEDAGREDTDDRGDGDPEVGAVDTPHAAQLRDVHHAEHDGIDDDRREDGLG